MADRGLSDVQKKGLMDVYILDVDLSLFEMQPLGAEKAKDLTAL